MMIKVFTTDKDGKIKLSSKELKELLDEAYWEGYRANKNSWTYTTPSWTPFYYTTTAGSSSITLNSDTSNTTTATINGGEYGLTGNNATSYTTSASTSL